MKEVKQRGKILGAGYREAPAQRGRGGRGGRKSWVEDGSPRSHVTTVLHLIWLNQEGTAEFPELKHGRARAHQNQVKLFQNQVKPSELELMDQKMFISPPQPPTGREERLKFGKMYTPLLI